MSLNSRKKISGLRAQKLTWESKNSDEKIKGKMLGNSEITANQNTQRNKNFWSLGYLPRPKWSIWFEKKDSNSKHLEAFKLLCELQVLLLTNTLNRYPQECSPFGVLVLGMIRASLLPYFSSIYVCEFSTPLFKISVLSLCGLTKNIY